jgi:hypothetical protein
MDINDEKVKVELVSMDDIENGNDEIDRKNAEIQRKIMNAKPSVEAIPDLDVLTGTVYEVLMYLEKTETKKIMKKDSHIIRNYLYNTYSDKMPPSAINLLLQGRDKDTEENRKLIDSNIERLLNMFELLKKAKKREISLDDAQKTIVDDVFKHSEYGSKESFENALSKAMMEEGKNNMKNIDKVKINIKN